MATNYYDTMSSGNTITFTNWNKMIDDDHTRKYFSFHTPIN